MSLEIILATFSNLIFKHIEITEDFDIPRKKLSLLSFLERKIRNGYKLLFVLPKINAQTYDIKK